MSEGWPGYARTVLGRAWRQAWRLAWQKLGVSVTMTLLTACFLWWFAAESGVPYLLFALLPGSVACAALAVFLVFFTWSLLTVPHEIHTEQAQAADAAAQASAAEIARLTAAVAAAHTALDDRAQRRESRDVLGRFLAEGTDLLTRIADGSFGALTAEVQDWLARLRPHVSDTRGAGGLAQLESAAGLLPMILTDPPAPGGVGRRIVTGERAVTSVLVRNRCARIEQFLAEDAR